MTEQESRKCDRAGARENGRERQREKQTDSLPSREPDMGLNPRIRGSGPQEKAGT